MKRIVLACASMVLALASVASADKVVLKSGTSYDVRGFEISGNALKMVTPEGRAWAVVLSTVDVPATLKANGMSAGATVSPGWKSASAAVVSPVPVNAKNGQKSSDDEEKSADEPKKTRAERRAEREAQKAEESATREREQESSSSDEEKADEPKKTRAERRAERRAREAEERERESAREVAQEPASGQDSQAAADEPALTKYVVMANVGYNGTALNAASVSTITTATLLSTYTGQTGALFEVGGVYRLRGPWAASGTTEFFGGNATLLLNTSIPNPGNAPIVVQTTVPALSYRETAMNLDVSYSYVFRPQIVFEGFGGPTIFFERVQLLSAVPSAIAPVVATTSTDTAFGFNLGGGVNYRVRPWIGGGFSLRYNRATANVVDGLGAPVSFKVGGVHANFGVRFFFK